MLSGGTIEEIELVATIKKTQRDLHSHVCSFMNWIAF
jgi:hypothetical protein